VPACWHLPIILVLKRVIWVDGPQALFPVLLLTLLFAAFSWRFFEYPLMMRFRNQR
jgi:peptidoglycan/LPS O-acetylase OafA/YrhL